MTQVVLHLPILLMLAEGEKPGLSPFAWLALLGLVLFVIFVIATSGPPPNQAAQAPPVFQPLDRVPDAGQQLLGEVGDLGAFQPYQAQLPRRSDQRGIVHVHVDKVNIIVTSCPDPHAHIRGMHGVPRFPEDGA